MKIGEALKIAVNDRDLASIAAITDRLRFEAGMKYNDVYHFARRNGVTLSFAEWDVLMREISDYNLRHLIMRSFMRCMEKEGDSHDVRNCIREYSDVLTDHDLFEMAALCIQSHIGRKNSGKADADWLAFKEEWIDWELKRREGRRE